VIAGLCFIIPAVIITAIFAWAYKEYGALPDVYPFIYGIKPAIIAVIAALMIRLAHNALKNFWLGVIGIICVALVLLGVSEIAVLFAAGITGILFRLIMRTKHTFFFAPFVAAFLSAPAASLSNLKIFLVFLKIGAILYGSGYVLFAFLEDELVSKGLLTKQQLIDAIAVGQFTPGPVFSSATFIGWQLSGVQGALVASVGIFLPSFLFVALLNPLIPKLRQSAVMASFLDCVNIASIAIMLAVIFQLGREVLNDWRSLLIVFLGFIATFYFKKLNTAWVIAGGALLGYLLWLATTA
jgi:chromate transporter